MRITLDFLLLLAVMALVTYLVRMLPFVLVRRQITSRFLLSFLHYIPYTVLAAMTFPAILGSTGSLPTAISGLAVGVVLAFWRKGLLTVALASSAAALITALILLI